MAISIKTKEEIEMLREGGKCLAKILEEIVTMVHPGTSTAELDRRAEHLIESAGGLSSFKGYRIQGVQSPYPSVICVSINDEVVHGIPRHDRVLQEGDVVAIDIGMKFPKDRGLHTDMAVTIGIGKISSEAENLITRTKESLDVGISVVRPGAKVSDIGYAVGQYLGKYKLGVIRDLAGHGVGYELHEDPLIPNFGKPGTGETLQEGMVIAIEPMATLGGWKVELQEDEWTFKTQDRSIAAHFEHTVAVTKNSAEVLTVFN